MKVLGATNGKYFVASAARHHCVMFDGILRDGGQAGTESYAGYTRGSGKSCWAEVPDMTFGEFYTDYIRGKENCGIWKFSEVRILSADEIPDTESELWQLQNALWGTFGKTGEELLRYIHLWTAEEEHLLKIVENRPEMEEKVNRILELRNENLS